MNKNIKRTIAFTLALGTITAVGSSKYTNFFTTEAHASSSSADELTDLELETSSGSSLTLYTDSSYDDKLDDDLTVGDTYYAKTSAGKVVINSITGADDDNVRIFKGSTAYEVGDDISISKDTTTTLKVRVYEDEYDEDEDYSSSDYNQYTIVVKNTNTEDDVDLLGIISSAGAIAFNPDITSYNVNVSKDATSLIVQAKPKDSDYTVTIDGSTVDSDDDYKKTVSLSESSSTDTIKVKVSDDDYSKTYTLNINKTSAVGMGQQFNQFGNQNNNFNQRLNNGISNPNGNNQAGWQKKDGLWYYFDNLGQKKTGWMQDGGKWYYLQSNGIMAANTIINGYKVGADGAWIQ